MVECHILKVQLAVNHRGVPIWWCGPHIGSQHDLKVWREYRPKLEEGEQWLGDLAYKSSRHPELVVPIKRIRRTKKKLPKDLTTKESASNRIHSWYRSTVEHTIGIYLFYSFILSFHHSFSIFYLSICFFK